MLPLPVKLLITQVDEQVKIRLTSQLIKVISSVFQKLHKYFNDTAIWISFELPLAGLFPVTFTLNLNDSEFYKVSFSSSL